MCGTAAELAAAIRHPYLDADGKLKQEDGEVVICIGKYRGRRVSDVVAQDRGYVEWMAREMGSDVARCLLPYIRNSAMTMNGHLQGA
jgi:hypothetical protein